MQPVAIRSGDGEVGHEVAQVELVEQIEPPGVEVGEFQLGCVVRRTHVCRVYSALRRVALARKVFALPRSSAADLAGRTRITGGAAGVERCVLLTLEIVRHAFLVRHVQARVVVVGWPREVRR